MPANPRGCRTPGRAREHLRFVRNGYVVILSATKGLALFSVRLNCRFFAARRMTMARTRGGTPEASNISSRG